MEVIDFHFTFSRHSFYVFVHFRSSYVKKYVAKLRKQGINALPILIIEMATQFSSSKWVDLHFDFSELKLSACC